jgi:hypothetical protein
LCSRASEECPGRRPRPRRCRCCQHPHRLRPQSRPESRTSRRSPSSQAGYEKACGAPFETLLGAHERNDLGVRWQSSRTVLNTRRLFLARELPKVSGSPSVADDGTGSKRRLVAHHKGPSGTRRYWP